MSKLVAKQYESMLAMGHGCGLSTVRESYHQLVSHWDAFFSYHTANEEIGKLEEYIVTNGGFDKTILEVMGAAWVEDLDRQEREFFKKDTDFIGNFDEEDFLTGVTCNPDAPEECESCQ